MTGEYESGHEAIARRAYALYESRGREDGRDKEDWAEAEAQLARQTGGAPSEPGAGANVPVQSGGFGERAGEVMPDVPPASPSEPPQQLPPAGV